MTNNAAERDISLIVRFQNIRELYYFICCNYVDGDDIILVGFSRGAFTARSVADMIASVGLLTMEGLEHFYPIFVDYENMGDEKRDVKEYLYKDLAPYKGQKGTARIRWEDERMAAYRNWLKEVSRYKPIGLHVSRFSREHRITIRGLRSKMEPLK
jgi:Uncharacterized alpha/beta hydrolase domain (DUF2235)